MGRSSKGASVFFCGVSPALQTPTAGLTFGQYAFSWWLLNGPAISLYNPVRQPFNACRLIPYPFSKVPSVVTIIIGSYPKKGMV